MTPWLDDGDVRLCACGCGGTVQSPDARGRPRLFLRGHNARISNNFPSWTGRQHTSESRRRLSIAAQARATSTTPAAGRAKAQRRIPMPELCERCRIVPPYTRTYIVAPDDDGSFVVTELYNGVFVTIGGTHQPNGPCGEEDPFLPAGIEGTFYGDLAVLVPIGSDFNQNAVCPPGCTTSDFFASVFAKPANFLDTATYAWSFYYHAPGHGDWANTDHGNTGNITP